MKKFSTVFLGITAALLLLWQLPWLYSFMVPNKDKSPFVLYSPVLNDFTYSIGEGKQFIHTDSEGNRYTQQQIDSLHPVFYGRQLMSDGRFPDSIAMLPANYKEIQQNVFYFRHSPRDINRPQLGIYQMMESMSGRVKLETPIDVFRIGNSGITFIDIESNQINPEKSSRFTDAMRKHGFVFPAICLSGNPSVKKDYDEGYLMLDAERKLYHIKQVKGRPFVQQIETPEGIVPKQLFITEFRNRSMLGFVSDTKNRLYAVTSADHRFVRLDIPEFDPAKNAMMIYGMVYQWTVKISSKEKAAYYALDGKTLRLTKSYEVPQETSLAKTIGQGLGLIGIRFSDPLDKFIYPRIGK